MPLQTIEPHYKTIHNDPKLKRSTPMCCHKIGSLHPSYSVHVVHCVTNH